MARLRAEVQCRRPRIRRNDGDKFCLVSRSRSDRRRRQLPDAPHDQLKRLHDPIIPTGNESQRKRIIATQAVANTSASQAMISSDRSQKEIKPADFNEQSANSLGIKIDLLRVSSATVTNELGRGFERLNGALERSQRDQREILAKLDKLQERLDRLENQSASASNREPAQPLEKPVAARPAPLPHEPSALPTTVEGPKSTAAPTPIRRIENWTVRDVMDGMAILAGPRGLIEVWSGDVVPGLGRVESISRRAGRWVVATSRGVITGP
jgi:chaperonin cofactor prefoldin